MTGLKEHGLMESDTELVCALLRFLFLNIILGLTYTGDGSVGVAEYRHGIPHGRYTVYEGET